MYGDGRGTASIPSRETTGSRGSVGKPLIFGSVSCIVLKRGVRQQRAHKRRYEYALYFRQPLQWSRSFRHCQQKGASEHDRVRSAQSTCEDENTDENNASGHECARSDQCIGPHVSGFRPRSQTGSLPVPTGFIGSSLLSTHSAATSKGATPSILLYTGQVLYAIPFIGGGGEA